MPWGFEVLTGDLEAASCLKYYVAEYHLGSPPLPKQMSLDTVLGPSQGMSDAV